MSRYKSLTDEEIRRIIELDDETQEETEDISDDEYIPNSCDSSSQDQSSEDEEENIDEGHAVTDCRGCDVYMAAPSGDKWYSRTSNSAGRMCAANVMTSQPGITAYAGSRITSDPISAFNLIFDQNMKVTILVETNRQGEKAIKNWKKMAMDEFEAYLGLCILRGVYKSKHQAVRQLWNPSYGPPIFAKTMSVNRFEEIRRALRFDNPVTRQSRIVRDKLAAVRLLIDGFIENSQKCYRHTECVTVDEQLYPYRGRCRFIQYMPSKPAKYGLKFWILADAESYYVSNIEMYTGKDPQRTQDLGMHVVLKLSEHLKNSGRNITCDNFFTSLKLARELKEKKLSLVGTVRNNRREVPHEFRAIKNKQLYESNCAFSEDGALLVSYKAKKNKNVILLSTQHKENKISIGEKKKPELVLYYNKTKGGVDCADERIASYSIKYISKRWHVPVFCNIVDLSCYNAYVLYTTVFQEYQQGKSHKRRLFLSDLGMALSENHRNSRVTGAPVPSISSNVEPKKRGRCAFCPRNKDKKSVHRCFKCNSVACTDHMLVICPSCNGNDS